MTTHVVLRRSKATGRHQSIGRYLTKAAAQLAAREARANDQYHAYSYSITRA